MHQTYSGNIQDAKHFKERLPQILLILDELNIDKAKITLVFDKGTQ